MIEPALAAVALPGRVDQREVARLAGDQELLLQCDQQRFRNAAADETTDGDSVAVVDETNCIHGGNDLIPLARGRRQQRLRRLSVHPIFPFLIASGVASVCQKSALRAVSVEKLPISLARGELALARNVLHDSAN